MKRFDQFIDGKWVAPASKLYDTLTNPYTGEQWAHVARGGAADVNLAVGAAEAALSGSWGAFTPTERGAVLRRMGDLLAERAEEFATAQVRENAKPIAETLPQTRNASECLYYYAGLSDKIEGKVRSEEHTSELQSLMRISY